ncbi:unnamed protein product [Linum trigynum]|uniref:Cysteine proteinase inhibitor n=1 Tax=Linum trigynum TaxID=586398 RepID=A0AAV2EIX8_9ROSI
MTKRSPLAAMLVLMISVLISVKPVASSCYKYYYGPAYPMSHQEVQLEKNQRLARFAVDEHNKVLSGAQRLKLVSVEDGA